MYAKILANMVATSHQMNAKAEGDYIGPDPLLRQVPHQEGNLRDDQG